MFEKSNKSIIHKSVLKDVKLYQEPWTKFSLKQIIGKGTSASNYQFWVTISTTLLMKQGKYKIINRKSQTNNLSFVEKLHG